jgi:hypothetical protein
MTEQTSLSETSETATYCAVHPDRETGLRCNKCDRYMCAECAVQTPVGYRCKQCVRQTEDKFFNASQMDYGIIFGVCGALSAVGTFAASLIGFIWIIIFFLSVSVGGAISEAAIRATGRRRGRYSAEAAAAGVIAGALAHDWLLVGVITPTALIFGGVVAFIVYGRFKMRG